MSEEQRTSIHLDTPSALRAMAHPLRLRIIGSLRSDGPQTVGELSEKLDAAPGSISYHLNTLQKHDFVELAPELARDRRESWWRASAEATTFEPAEMQADPESRVAGRLLRQTIVQRQVAEQITYLETEETLPPDWIAASTMGDDVIWLTASELKQLGAELNELVSKWQSKGNRDREGTAPTHVLYTAYRRP